MDVSWHKILSETLGSYDPVSKSLGFDYGKLFLDARAAKLTYWHEVTHSLISRTTDFGQATEYIYRFLPEMNHVDSVKRKEVIIALRSSQIFVQEGTATLMQILLLMEHENKRRALEWAEKRLPREYLERFKELEFVLDLGLNYREKFTMKIPHLAMHTAIRKKIVELDLLRDPVDLIDFLKKDENNPDKRYKEMIEVIRFKDFLVTKETKDICEECKIKQFEDVTKKDVANFVNYLLSFTKHEQRLDESQITDQKEHSKLVLKDTNNRILVGNLNLDISGSAELLMDINDLLFYKDDVEIVFVNLLPENFDYGKLMKTIHSRKFEATIIAIRSGGVKHFAPLDKKTLVKILDNEFRDKTLIVKWGLYDFGGRGLKFFGETTRDPNIVLYNTTEHMSEKLQNFSGSKLRHYHIGSSADNPLQTFVVRQDKILHMVNTFGDVKIQDIKKNYKEKITAGDIKELEPLSKHFNNTLSFWMNLSWEVDWYQTISKQDAVYHRKQ